MERAPTEADLSVSSGLQADHTPDSGSYLGMFRRFTKRPALQKTLHCGREGTVAVGEAC